MAHLTVDGQSVRVRDGANLLEAVRASGAVVPTLCHHPALEPWGGCRLCVVDITREGWNGRRRMVVACLYPAEDGLTVETSTERVLATRRVVLDLLLARCPDTPLIQRLAREHGLTHTSYRTSAEPTDCILCGLCTRACDQIGVSAIASAGRGAGREVAPPFHEPPPACIGCLACAEVCPTGHIRYEASGDRRTIWGKTFVMVHCPQCGDGHITREQAAFERERHGVPDDDVAMCDACKRARAAAMFVSLGAADGLS